MNRKKKKKRRIRIGRVLFLLLMFAATVYAIFWIISSLFKPASEVIDLNFQTIPIKSHHRALILRDETVATTQNGGVFEASVDQAQKVRNSQAIGYIKVGDASNAANGDESDKNIEKSSNNEFILDEQSLENDMQSAYNFMLKNLKSGKYIQAIEDKKNLQYKLDRLKKLEEQNSENAFSLIEKSKMKVGSSKASGGQSVDVYTSKSGIVSFYIDGLEDVLNYDNRYKIDYQAILDKNVENKDTRGTYISKDSALFKIIKANVWYIAAEIPREDLSLYRPKTKLIVRDGVNKEDVSATIQEVFDTGKSAILILKLTNQLPILYKDRISDIVLIRDNVRGLEIPKSAIVIKDNKIGVYALDIENRLYFVMVDLIVDLDSKIVVREGSIRKVLPDGKIQIIETVKHGDTIVRNANLYREGEIIENIRK